MPSQTAKPQSKPAELSPAQKALLDKRSALVENEKKMVMTYDGIRASRAAVPRNPRNQYRKKHRAINKEVVALNKQIDEHNAQVKAFNADPIRHKYRIPELKKTPRIPYPNYGQKD
jgi:uncharacterized coiled-coil DUF342 family protein